MQNKDKTSAGDKINDFIQRNRKGIFIIISVIIFLFVGIIVYIAVSEQINNKAIAAAEELKIEFDGLREKFNSEEDADISEVNALLEKLREFAGNRNGFAGGKAWSMIAQIHSSREEWTNAEEAWLNCARAGDKTYLAPIAYFNAAAAAEEQGKIEQAIEYFNKCVSHKFEFPDAPRAQFNIGRLYEQLGNSQEALNAYRAVIIKYSWDRTSSNNPGMLIWQNLARNRIIRLEI